MRARSIDFRSITVITANRTSDLLRWKRFRDVSELRWKERKSVSTSAGKIDIAAFRVKHWGVRTRRDTYRGYNGYGFERNNRRIIFSGHFSHEGTNCRYRDGQTDPSIKDGGNSRAYERGIGRHNPVNYPVMPSDGTRRMLIKMLAMCLPYFVAAYGAPSGRTSAAAHCPLTASESSKNPLKYPSGTLPISPRKIFAGCQLSTRKPRHAPVRSRESVSANGSLIPANSRKMKAPVAIAIVSTLVIPSIPSIKL